MAELASLGLAERPRRRVLKLDPLWLALPGLAFLALFLILPTAQMLSLSFFDKITGALTLSASRQDLEQEAPTLAVLETTFSLMSAWTIRICASGWVIPCLLARA